MVDVAVVGGGPGGYVAAVRAAQLGLKTVLIEAADLGGTCLNWGCIPTKALLERAKILETLSKTPGITASVEINLAEMMASTRTVVGTLQGGIRHLLQNVTVIKGYAKLLGQGRLQVNDQTISAKHIILATGSRPRTLPGLEGPGVWTSKEALQATEVPKRLLVIGAGAIGLEFASFYRAVGSEVTVVEMQSRILPLEDEEASAVLQKSMEKRGVSFKLNVLTEKFERTEAGWSVFLKGQPAPLEADVVLVAIGVLPNTENLGLENTAVRLHKGSIVTHGICETDEQNVYAIGDVASPPWLAHKASREGVLVAEHLAGHSVKPLAPEDVPSCVYTLPQLARIGMTETEAAAHVKNAGLTLKIGRFPYQASGKAMAIGKTEGLVKVLYAAETGELLGGHIVGEQATELLAGLIVARACEATEETLRAALFPHPTLSEMLGEATDQAFGRAIHTV